MSGNFYLDWAIMAVSLFNTILLIWLGLTVLLNSDRHTWGIWLAGGGMLLGGAFFISHTAILGHGLTYVSWGTNFWWRAGWIPVVILPFVWYLIMLWYSGFWDNRRTSLHRRQWPWFLLTIGLGVTLTGLLLFANPLPSYSQVTQLRLSATPAIGGIPLLILVYPLYIVLCISLSLDALRRPAPSARVMGDLARRRARPWLMATALVLLMVSLLVAWVMVWLVANARPGNLHSSYTELSRTVAWFDLTIASLIGLVIILQGQAIVAYEVFTGRSLPRRGLQRQWQRAIILAGGYGVVIGWSLVSQLRPIYGLLLSALLLTGFYALLSWRAYAERERSIEQLRPFVTSQRLFEQLIAADAAADPAATTTGSFQTLCRDILETKLAWLIPWGPLAPLVGPALTYSDQASPGSLPSLTELVNRFDSPWPTCLALDPTRYRGAIWAIPLWSERGLSGLLLLGEKRGGGLYTQEEIEIAQASSERLIDTQASAELARRLMALQRQRLTHSQVIDQQTRRLLHDDVLPQLHAAILTLNSPHNPATSTQEAIALLADTHRKISGLLRASPPTSLPDVTRSGLIAALQRVISAELPNAFDEVSWHITPEAAVQAAELSALTVEVLFYAAREAIRNAARYGRGQDTGRSLRLLVEVGWQDGLIVRIEDDGAGLQTTKEANSDGGSGQGLALHSTMMAVIGGYLSIDSTPGSYTRVSLALPQEILSESR